MVPARHSDDSEDGPRVGIVTTLRLPDRPGAERVLASFLDYHLAKDFAHVFLFLDAPQQHVCVAPRVLASDGDAAADQRARRRAALVIEHDHLGRPR